MKINITPKEALQGWKGSVIAIGLLEENLEQQLKVIEDLLGLFFSKEDLNSRDFKAQSGQVLTFQFINKNPEKIVLIGLGVPEKLLLDSLRNAACIASRESLGFKGSLGLFFPWDAFNSISAAKVAAEACQLSVFKDIRFKSDPNEKTRPNQIDLLGLPKNTAKELDEVHAICAGVEFARELVGEPPNSLTPNAMAERSIKIANKYNLKAKILNKGECEKEGMGAYLAVAKGSDLDPKFIHLSYLPKGKSTKKIIMIGKGLTFDSGGYNLKVGASQIEKMKYDMGGSAAVLGAARAIGEIRPNNIEVHFIIASCENMINGSACHPGDIITASNGKTIEVNNTDAEGRLTLADALVYACRLKPDAIVDLATLTGACVIALGDELAGLWSENDLLSNQLLSSANEAGEGLWRMPMQNSYKDGLKSMFADLQNTGPRAGGSITAALFLKEFVKEEIPWAHIDIAGTCWTEKEKGVNPAGATGYGVRTLVKWACNQAKENSKIKS